MKPSRSTGSQRRSRARTSVRTCLRARPRGLQRRVHRASRSSRRTTSTVRSADWRTRVLTRAAAMLKGLTAHPALLRLCGCLFVCLFVYSAHSQPRLAGRLFVWFGVTHFAAWRLGCLACRARGQPQAAQVPRERPQARARAGGERTSLARTTARVLLAQYPQKSARLVLGVLTAESRMDDTAQHCRALHLWRCCCALPVGWYRIVGIIASAYSLRCVSRARAYVTLVS